MSACFVFFEPLLPVDLDVVGDYSPVLVTLVVFCWSMSCDVLVPVPFRFDLFTFIFGAHFPVVGGGDRSGGEYEVVGDSFRLDFEFYFGFGLFARFVAVFFHGLNKIILKMCCFIIKSH